MNLMFVAPGQVGSSEILLTNLAAALAGAGHEVVVFALRGFSGAHPRVAAAAEVVEVPWSSPRAQALRIPAEHTWLQAQIRRRRLDVIHHGVGTSPFFSLAPAVVTVHDIQYVHYPANFSTAKRAWLALNVPHTVRHSVVTPPSSFVKADLVARLGADPGRVVVVPFGGTGLFGDEADGEAGGGGYDVRGRHRLDKPFFFFPGHTYAHKNHVFLMEAFAPLAGRVHLVFTGAPWRNDAAVAAAAARLGISGSVSHLGLLPRAGLKALYTEAVALAYPSRFEGFGAPLLEAMSCGCPVVSSNAASLPEVAGDAALLLDPSDRKAWTAALERLLDDDGERTRLAAAGRRRLGEFSWERSAALQAKAYAMAAGA